MTDNRFPYSISAWATNEGRYGFDCDRLFPVGEAAQYVLAAQSARDAALFFRNPDEFERLLQELERDGGASLREKLDGALSAIAKADGRSS